ncbi:MAG: hypothetical protein HDS96_00700 [Bacteroidales bacterium]|nr:hypothetical protein [Bacteroidales bacterium]
MDVTPIKRLRLKAAYDDSQQFQKITCDSDFVQELFEWTNRGLVFIHDDAEAGYSRFVLDTNGLGAPKTLRVENGGHKDLFLWHIDGILYKKESKCDCAILTDNSLSFIEFKSNAANNSREAIIENYEKAMSQLRLTYDDVSCRCQNVGVDLKATTKIEAYAVFNRTVPSHNAYQKKLAAQFQNVTKGIQLYFKNSTEV